MENENLLKEEIFPQKLSMSSHDTGSKSAELYIYQACSIQKINHIRM